MRFRPGWLAASVLGSALSISPAAKSQVVDIPYESFTLDNGLRVVVHEDHKAPIVTVNVWYHVGSKDEKPGKTGFAHLFEHLMFQGSENFPDEYFKPFEKVGATGQNGTTWLDRTNYFQNVPTTALDMALWMESDRMGHFKGAITQELLDEQRGVVQNEKRQGENQPHGKYFETLQRYSFPEGHPYRWETIGSMDDLNAASLDDVKQWFADYYGPNNAVLVLAGDIDVATAKQKAQQYFGDIPAGPPVDRIDTWVAPRTEPRRVMMQDRVAQSRVSLSWNVAELGNPELVPLDLFASILGGGKTSRLYKRLVYTDQIADSASAGVMGFELASLFVIQADVKKGVDPARVEKAIREELARLLRDGPTAAELERAQTAGRASLVRGVERVGGFGGKAQVLAQCAVYQNDPGCFRVEQQQANSATPAQLKQAANKWLSHGDLTIQTDPFPTYSNAEKGVDRSTGVPEVNEFPDLSFPALQRATLKNGMEVILARRSSIPVVNVELLFDAGYAADQGVKPGTASFTMDMLDEGSKTRGPLELAAEAESLGARLWAGASLDDAQVGVSALTENLRPSLALLSDMVRNPAFDEKEFKRVQAQRLAGIAREKTQPASMAMRILPPLLYGEGHAYAMPMTGSGTEEALAAMTPDDLRQYQQNWLRPDNAKLLVVGDTTLEAVLPELERAFGDWKAPATPKPSKRIDRVALPESPRVFIMDKPGSVQSMIIAGELAPSTGADNFLETETMNDVLGGTFTARLNMNLREDKSWAYGAYSFLVNALGQRPMMLYAPVQTDKTVDSIKELQKEIAAYIGDKPATAEEIAKIKAKDVRSLPGKYETASAVLGAIESMQLYGRPDDYVSTLKSRIEAQDDDAIRAAARQIIKPGAFTWVIVGDRSQIEQPIRELMGESVQVIDADGKLVK
ncbi:MAG: insulinase family protein [Xanthomonadales bacterium]|nr:insulinase family protein [Xanthomonadales bacterium]